MSENSDLSRLFEAVTDRVEPPRLADESWRIARRLRARMVATTGAAATAAVLVTVAALSQVGGGGTDDPVGPATSPPSSLSSPAASAVSEPLAAEPLRPADVQAPWDPDDVADLPASTLPLPADLQPGSDGGPVSRAVAAVAAEDGLWLVDDAARWSRLDYPAGAGGPGSGSLAGRVVALAPDGSRVAVLGTDAIWWREVGSGSWRSTPYPSGWRGETDWFARLDLLGTERFLLTEGWRSWVVDGASGAAQRLPYDAVDEVVPAGDGVLADRFDEPGGERIETWLDAERYDHGDPGALESLQRPASDAVSMAGVRANGATVGGGDVTDTDGLIALDLADLSVRGFLPVPSAATFYSDNANLTPLGWLDADTVLAEVRPRADAETTWLFTWNVESGDLARVASYPTGLVVAVALEALGSP